MSTNLADEKSKRQRYLSNAVNYVLSNLQGKSAKDENEDFIKTINKARQDMLDAQSYFDSVTAPELIDHAIYKMDAARAQYIYLLKLAKDKGLSVKI